MYACIYIVRFISFRSVWLVCLFAFHSFVVGVFFSLSILGSCLIRLNELVACSCHNELCQTLFFCVSSMVVFSLESEENRAHNDSCIAIHLFQSALLFCLFREMHRLLYYCVFSRIHSKRYISSVVSLWLVNCLEDFFRI